MVHAIAFPPLGNRLLVGAVTTDATGDPGFDHLAGLVSSAPVGPLSDLDPSATGWLSSLVQRANQDTFRAALTGPAGDPSPRLAQLTADGIGGLDRSPLLEGRGTAKLVVVVGVAGDGTASLDLAGAGGSPELRLGTVAVWPSYLVATGWRVTGDLTVLVVTFEGPAWR